jgi:hypothetical protein
MNTPSKEALKVIEKFELENREDPLLLDSVGCYSNLDNLLKYDETIISYFLKRDLKIWECLPESLKEDKQFVLRIMNSNNNFLSCLNDGFKKDKDIVLKACSLNGGNLFYANDFLRNDFDIALAAVTQYGYALKNCSTKLQSNAKIVTTALKETIAPISYSNLELWENPEPLLEKVDFIKFIYFISIHGFLNANIPYVALIKNKLKIHQNKCFALHIEPQIVKGWWEMLDEVDKHRENNDDLVFEMIDLSEPFIKFWSDDTIKLMKEDTEKMKTKFPECKEKLLIFIEKELQRREIIYINPHEIKKKDSTKTRKIKF